MPIPQDRFTEITMAFVGPMPKLKRLDTIMGRTDRFTCYVKLEIVRSAATALEIADVLVYQSWYQQFGLP